MKTSSRMALVALGGLTVGGVSMSLLQAQTPAKAPAFYVADFELTDPEGIRPYSANVASTFEPFGGRFIVRGGAVTPLEGDPPKGRLVVIVFESKEKAQAWYDSPAYVELRPQRQKSGRTRAFIVEGTPN